MYIFFPMMILSTSDPAHILHRYNTGLHAKFCGHISYHFWGDHKHMLMKLRWLSVI